MFGSGVFIKDLYEVSGSSSGEYDGAVTADPVDVSMSSPSPLKGRRKGIIAVVTDGSTSDEFITGITLKISDGASIKSDTGIKIFEQVAGGPTSVWFFDNDNMNAIFANPALSGITNCEYTHDKTVSNVAVRFFFVEGVNTVTTQDDGSVNNQTVGISGFTLPRTITGALGDIVIGVCSTFDAALPGGDTNGLFPAEADTTFTSSNDTIVKQFTFVDDSAATTPEIYTYGMENTAGDFSYEIIEFVLIHVSPV